MQRFGHFYEKCELRALKRLDDDNMMKMNKSILKKWPALIAVAGLLMPLSACKANVHSLVPNGPSNAPDYFSTWNIQGYVCSYEGGKQTEALMTEQSMFGQAKYQDWVHFFPKFRKDLIFVMDDSWDIPVGKDGEGQYYGAARLDEGRFPSFKGSPTERLRALVNKVKASGWKGLGGWICAQEAPVVPESAHPENYWIDRMKESEAAGITYWKVDFGAHEKDSTWRRMLTRLGHQYAPHLCIEHAMVYPAVKFADAFRTYDVENIISVPVTIQRVANLLRYKAEPGSHSIINCEDEPYIAVGLGCAIGVMRHPYNGVLPNGKQDHVFPPVGRNLKNRLDELVRALHWHRMAVPFGVNADAIIDSEMQQDWWLLHERETWMARQVGDTVRGAAPARISRRMPLPKVVSEDPKTAPYVLASRYPNGAVAVAAIERVLGRTCVLHPVTVTLNIVSTSEPIGIFGEYKQLVLQYDGNFSPKCKVYGQDLAGNKPVDITHKVQMNDHRLVVPGEVIHKIGLMAATKGDQSAPGMVLVIR